MLFFELYLQFGVGLKIAGHDDQGNRVLRARHMSGEGHADGDVGQKPWSQSGCKDDGRGQLLLGRNLGLALGKRDKRVRHRKCRQPINIG